MSDPNSALSAWQLAIIAVVAVTTLAAWLAAVYLAAREPRSSDGAVTASPTQTTGNVAAGTSGPSRQASPSRRSRPEAG
jgi:hypothetical protein